jgi:hypothetical protein
MRIVIKPTDFPCSLDECLPGPFVTMGKDGLELVGFKSEYRTPNGNAEAFCGNTGEFFWGGAKDHEARSRMQVWPCQFAREEDE